MARRRRADRPACVGPGRVPRCTGGGSEETARRRGVRARGRACRSSRGRQGAVLGIGRPGRSDAGPRVHRAGLRPALVNQPDRPSRPGHRGRPRAPGNPPRTAQSDGARSPGRARSKPGQDRLARGDAPSCVRRQPPRERAQQHHRCAHQQAAGKLGKPIYLQTVRGIGFTASTLRANRSTVAVLERGRQQQRERREAWARSSSAAATDHNTPRRGRGREFTR
jgi:hypothetical protein